MPAADRLDYYRIQRIASATRTPPDQLGVALRFLGWTRVQVRILGIATAVWVAPGGRSPLRAIGRPKKS